MKTFNDYYNVACSLYIQENKDLRAKERENHHLNITKGELPESHVQAYDKLRKNVEKLQGHLSSLAEILNK